MCGMAHSYLRHDSFIVETWLTHMCDILAHTRETRMTWLMHTCDVTHSTWLHPREHVHSWENMFSRTCKKYVWHDWCIRATWLIRHDSTQENTFTLERTCSHTMAPALSSYFTRFSQAHPITFGVSFLLSQISIDDLVPYVSLAILLGVVRSTCRVSHVARMYQSWVMSHVCISRVIRNSVEVRWTTTNEIEIGEFDRRALQMQRSIGCISTANSRQNKFSLEKICSLKMAPALSRISQAVYPQPTAERINSLLRKHVLSRWRQLFLGYTTVYPPPIEYFGEMKIPRQNNLTQLAKKRTLCCA